jgi:phospholipid transport system transporter-binding protein
MIRREGDQLVVEGSVTLANVMQLIDAGSREVLAGARRVNLAAVTELDSGALAMLLAWRRTAVANQADLAFEGVGPDLVSLADLYGVEVLLPLNAGTA